LAKPPFNTSSSVGLYGRCLFERFDLSDPVWLGRYLEAPRQPVQLPLYQHCNCAEQQFANQPWHWVVIPAMGLCMGEIFYLKELAADCASDGIYEFFFCGPPLVITGGTGSPINPQAIK
jgi:hypothetical protein